MRNLLILLVPVCLLAQQPVFNDQQIMMLTQSGVSEVELLRLIAPAPNVDFDLRPVSTDALIKIGVSENVIKAMAARESGTTNVTPRPLLSAPSIATPAMTAQADTASISEIGVYLSNGAWAEMMPEVVNWKTGGVLKSLSTVGIVKGDVNGRLRGGTSRTRITRPIRLLVHCQEGTRSPSIN